MDLIFTVCGSAAAETCPVWPGHPASAHWGTEDPAAVRGSESLKMDAFRHAFRVLQHRVKACLELPVDNMTPDELNLALSEIGTSLPDLETGNNP